jgi:hypothetical protein
MVVQEGDKESRCFAMGADYVLFHLLSGRIHVHQRLGRCKAFQDGLEIKKERKIQRGVDADQFASILCVATNESRDIGLGVLVKDLSKSEEVLLADTQSELTHRVAEEPWQIAEKIAQRIDAEAIAIEAGYYVLERTNEKALYVRIIGSELLEGTEVADHIVANRYTLSPEEIVLLQFLFCRASGPEADCRCAVQSTQSHRMRTRRLYG